MKRIIALIITLAVSFTSLTAFAEQATSEIGYRVAPLLEQLKSMTNADIEAAANKFSDMKTHWSRATVGKITKLGIIAGRPDGKFGPDDPLMVEHFIKMTVCAMGFKVEPGAKYWAQPYIDIAKQYGIIGANEFTNYARPITRQEAAKIIYLAAMLKEPAPSQKNDAVILGNILDSQNIDSSYKRYVIGSYAMGVLCGTPESYYKPKDTLKRGEGSSIILRYLDVSARLPFVPENGFAIELPNWYQEWANVATAVNETLSEDSRYYVGEDPQRKYVVISKPGYKESIKLLYALKAHQQKDTMGYNSIVGNLDNYCSVGNACYESKQSYMDNQIGFHMTFAIEYYPGDYLYSMTVYNPIKTKELHMDTIKIILDTLFGSDNNKAYSQLSSYIDYYVRGSVPPNKSATLYFNNRKMTLYFGTDTFSCYFS